MNRHLNNHNADIIDVLQEAEKQFPKADLGTEGIPLDAVPTMWLYAMFRKAGARAAFEWIRDRMESSLGLGYESPVEPDAPTATPDNVVDYLQAYDVQQTEDS